MNNTKIKNLALGGGGIFGYAEMGALSELLKYKDHLDLTSISGTSVGSIVATLYAIGYSIDELNAIIFDMNFDTLIRDNSIPYINLYEKFGMYEAKKLEDEIERLIMNKMNIKQCTFSQIEMNLTVVATNISHQKAVFFNKTTYPKMVVSKAIRMSISYPIVMMPVLFEDDYWGDGGEFVNYPIINFPPNEETIGITFAAHNENRDGTLKSKVFIKNVIDYFKSVATTMSRSAYISQLTPEYLGRSIVVQITDDISSTQFNITTEQKKNMYHCGVIAVQEQIGRILGIITPDIIPDCIETIPLDLPIEILPVYNDMDELNQQAIIQLMCKITDEI